jgi:membrane-bound ClpP family serine protease
MNNAMHVPVFLQLVGILVIIAEIILPSGGILSILATGLFGYSLYLVFTNISASAGMAFVIADLFIVPILVYFGIKFLAKSPVTLRTKLSKERRGDRSVSGPERLFRERVSRSPICDRPVLPELKINGWMSSPKASTLKSRPKLSLSP